MIRLGMMLAAVVVAISAGGGTVYAKMAMQTFPVLAGAGAHDVYPAPDGAVWFTAQSAGKLGRLDPTASGSTAAVCVSRSVEETRRPEMGELSPLPSMYDLVGDHPAEERRHRHAAMGDRDIVAGSPRHRSDGRQMVAGDRPDGDAHRLRFDLAD